MRRLSALLALAALCLAVPRASKAAVEPARAAHTTTLLPNGDVLIVGGMGAGGTPQKTAELFQATRGGTYQNVGSMTVARASATATLMPNGKVLIAGGIDDSAVVRSDVEVYDPATQTFGAPLAGLHARFSHTATLLNNGSVLLCGGMDTAPPTNTPTAACDYYTPQGVTVPGGALCGVAAGCINAAPSLAFARAFHTATLLKDGEVLFAGGFNPAAAATNGWLTTMERFHPAGSGSFGSAANLFEARAYHTATLLGDGKVLIAGGFNGNNRLENKGILDTQELYDPTADTVTPAPQLSTRRLMHTALLGADGAVEFYGGLGNITTTYQSPTPISLGTGFTLTDTYSGQLSTGDMTTPAGTFQFKDGLLLSKPVVGTIVNGSVVFSSASLDFGSGNAYFVAGSATDTATGLQANMAGVNVGCKPGQPASVNTCGFIDSSAKMTWNNLNQGKIFFHPYLAKTVNGTVSGPSSNAFFFTGGLTTSSTPATLNGGSNFTTSFVVPVAGNLVGATLLAGSLHVVSGTLVQDSSYTVTMTGATDLDLTGMTVASDGAGGGQLTFTNQSITGVTGTIAWSGGDSSYNLPPGPAPNSCGTPVPAACSIGTALTGGGTPTVSLKVDVKIVPDFVDVSNLTFTVDVSTIIIRSMVFNSPEFFTPKVNQTSLTQPDGAFPSVGVSGEKFGHTATLLPNNDRLYVGGLDCTTPAPVYPNLGCGALIPQNDFGNLRSDITYVVKNANWGGAGNTIKGRALHTATLLPSGKILIAGGTDGPNILSSAEVYDPTTQTSVATRGPMRDDRDLHSATLLPDGRVLIAGGFTTNATSTDSIANAEIYYPDTSLFLPTGTMGVPRRAHTATLLPDGTVLVVGGMTTGGVIIGTSEIYRSTTQVWSASASLPGGAERMGHTATLLKDGTVLVVGGTNAGGPMTSVYRFDPANPGAGWVARASLPHALYQHSATLLFDGRVLVAGGNDGFGEYNASYIYDPLADTWTLTDPVNQTPLLQPRYGHTATLLPNGTVMMTGGNTRFGVVPTQIEVFHVDASTWAAGGVTFSGGPRTFNTVTLAPDGYVYALGGSDGVIGGNGTTILSSVERAYFTTNPDQYTKNAPPSFRQASISSATPSIFQAGAGNTFTVSGVQFRGATEASGGGAGSANSSFSFPHLILQQIDGSGGGSAQSSGFVVDLTTEVYLNSDNYQNLDSSLTVALPQIAARLPIGWYNARVGANDLYSNGAYVQAGPVKPSAAPAIASGTPMGISSFTWTWSQVPGGAGLVDGYNVYEATSMVWLGSAPATTSPYFIQNNLPPNSTSQIVVAAYSLSGDGPLATAATTYTLSTSPINVQIASVTFNSLLLQWDGNGNTPGTVYEVSQSTDSPIPFSASVSTPVPTILGLTTTFVTITGLVTNSTYSFRIRSFNTAGIPSGFSAIVSTQTRNSVAGVGCGPNSSGDTSTSIQWSWNDAGAVIKYNVYSSSDGALIGSAASGNPTFSDVGLGTNTQRSIMVTAITAAGEGPLSGAATCYTLAATPGQGSPLMTSTETTSVSMNWTPNGNPNGTEYLVKFVSASSTTTLKTTQFQAYFSGLQPGAYYSATVAGVNQANFATTPPLSMGTTFTLPAQPQPLTIQGTTPVSIFGQWTQNGNSTMTAYQLTYSLDNFATNISTAIPFSAGYNGSTFTISGLITSTQYWLRVQAMNPFGQLSQFSSSVSTITFNGGAPQGSLAGTLTALGTSQFSGNLGDGTAFEMRSPGGAFPTDTTLTISTYDVSGAGHGPLCPNGVVNGIGQEAVAFSIVDSPAYQPIHPLVVDVSYTPSELPSPLSQVALARFDPASGTCVPLETSFNTVTKTFTAKLNHFSLYQLVNIPLATSADTARLYPNPFRAATDSYITIDQVPPASRVRVFTLRGERILDAMANGAGIVTWSADNSAGRPVASGLYLVEVESGGTKKLLKAVIIR